MEWKNWPYWVRGGVISGALFLIIYFLYGAFGSGFSSSDKVNPINITLLLLFIPIFFAYGLLESSGLGSAFFGGNCDIWRCATDLGNILIYATVILFYFIIGAIIGLIYGKIKNRGKNAN